MSDISIVEVLQTHNKNVLNDLGKQWGLTQLPKDRTPLARAIIAQMAETEQVQAKLDQLTERQRKLFEFIRMAGGQISTVALHRQALREKLFSQSSSFQIGRYNTYNPPADSFESEVVALMKRGLVLAPGPPRYGSQFLDLSLRTTLLIPPPIMATLPPLPAAGMQLEGEVPSLIAAGDAAAFQRDLYLYWSYVRDNAVSLTKQGMVNKTHLKRINATLTQTESLDSVRDEVQVGRMRFIRLALHGCRLIQKKGDMLTIVPDSEAFFLRPLAERVRAVYDYYRPTFSWDELLRIPDVVMRGRRAGDVHALPFVTAARQTVLRVLADHAGEGWQDLYLLEDHMLQRHYEFLLPRTVQSWAGISNPYNDYGNTMGWTFQANQFYEGPTGHTYTTPTILPDETTGWGVVEGGFIEAILCEPLHWMGLVDLGAAPDETYPETMLIIAFRLTPMGAHVLQGKPLPDDVEPTGGRLIVQPTFEVLAYPPVQETHLALLDRIAERQQLDQVASYRLTREALYRASQQYGMTVAEVIGALERESGANLPQNVTYTLHEWGRALERIVLHERVALVQADPDLLDSLTNLDATLLTRRLTPTTALVAQERYQQVEESLFKLGNLPVVHTTAPPLGDQFRTPRAYLQAEADGRLRFCPGAPQLYVKRVLAPFTVEAGDVLRITPAQVQQAVHDGMPVERIIALLAGWCANNLLIELERSIKIWGGFFGSASIERPVLLRLSDERTLTALLDDPEMVGLVQPYRPEGVLAQMNANDLPRLRKLLAARGIDLDDPQRRKR